MIASLTEKSIVCQRIIAYLFLRNIQSTYLPIHTYTTIDRSTADVYKKKRNYYFSRKGEIKINKFNLFL